MKFLQICNKGYARKGNNYILNVLWTQTLLLFFLQVRNKVGSSFWINLTLSLARSYHCQKLREIIVCFFLCKYTQPLEHEQDMNVCVKMTY